MERRLDPI